MEENTLQFTIAIEGTEKVQSDLKTAFGGIDKAVKDLSRKSVGDLQTIGIELMEVVDKFNQLSKAVGVDPKFLRQMISYMRELEREENRIQDARAKAASRSNQAELARIRERKANLEAERRAKEKLTQEEIATERKLAQIKIQSMNRLSRIRQQAHTEFINQINQQNRKIKEQADKQIKELERILNVKSGGFGSGFSQGAANVFTGKNHGHFSNILGGFGGGGRIGGTLAAAMDGAFSGSGGGMAGMAGGLAAGAGVGAMIALLTAYVAAVKAAVSATWEFSKAAVQMAADFEQTLNSVAVFAGGVNAASVELEKLHETVSNSPGLSIEGAEEGYRQLRALGFEADNARKLIEGLGNIRITSGASEQSIERVIVNLTQLQASTARAGQDIKEIIHALPAMRGIFREAFGSADAGTIKAAIERDGEAAFKKLADAMANAEKAAPGLNTAFTALRNEWILASREFGKPILPVLTQAVMDLTGWLKSNKSEFREWGMVAAEVLRDTVDLGKWVVENIDYFTPVFQMAKSVKGWFGVKDNSEEEKRIRNLKAAEEERLQAIEDAKTRATIEEEKRRQKEIKSIEQYSKLRQQTLENAFKLEEARVSGLSAYTVEQEIEKTRLLSDVRARRIKAQMASETDTFNKLIALNKGNNEKILELEIEKSETLNNLRTELQLNEINTMQAIREGERRIREQRRQDEIEFKNFQLSAAKFNYERVVAEVERGLSKQVISTTSAYATLRDVTERYYDDAIRIHREQMMLQLEDLSLTEAQRRNILERGFLEERQLAEQKKNALLKIQDDQLAAEEQRRERSLQRLKAYYQSLGEMASAAAGFFNPEGFSSRRLGDFRDQILGNALRRESNRLTDNYVSAENAFQTMDRAFYGTELGEQQQKALDKAKEASKQAYAEMSRVNQQLVELERNLSPAYSEMDKLGESVSKAAGNFKAFDEILKVSIRERHRLETESMTKEIENIEKRLAQARRDYQERLKERNADMGRSIESVKKDFGLTEDSEMVKTYRSLIKLNEDFLSMSNAPDFIPPTDRAIELNGELEQMRMNLFNLGLKQRAEEADAYANSLDGLAERLQMLQSGDAGAVNSVLNAVGKDILRERIALLEENIELEARIATVGDDSATRYRNAWLRAIYDVKSASEQARESQIRSQVEIADQTVFNADRARAGIMEAMAGAKGYTEIFQDAFLSVNDAIADGLSALTGKATEGLGAFGRVLSDIASQLLRMITNRLMMRVLDMMLPPTAGVAGAGSGGFKIGNIFRGIFGGGSPLGINLGGGASSGTSGGGGASALAQAAAGWITGGFNPNASLASAGTAGVGSAFGSISSLGKSDLLSTIAGLNSRTPDSVQAPGGDIMRTAFGRNGALLGSSGGWGNLLKSFGAMAPMLGLSLGAGIGGTSVGGQILGGIGGLAGGLALGIGTGAIGTGGGMIGGLVGALGGTMAATGILAAVAAPLLIGGWLLGRNKRRRQEEQIRTAHIQDALTQLEDILKRVRRHDMNGDEAVSAAEQVRETYRQNVSQLKDKKTRNIALKEINDRINPKIEQIRAAARVADENRKRFDDRIPEFATGGIVPGRFGEPRLVLAHGGEIIANPSQQTPAFLQAAAEAGIPGVKGFAQNGGGSNAPQSINVELVIGTDAQNQLFVNGAKSTKGYNLTIEQTKKAQKFRDVTF